MDTDADIDAAAADPPVFWLAVAVGGLVLAGTGVVTFVLDLLGLSGPILATVPFAAPFVSLSPIAAVLGIALFVFAMTEWSPDLET